MLKNKFGMTKVLVLVLSVLMLVSLVACNKADGPSTDDMNAAIQAAIDAANAEQAAKEAALAASIAADKAAQEAKDAAQAESLAKEKAENDAALKKAQEEAAAAAKKAEEASKAAADAAKKAAEEAAKAAEEAAKANEAALKKAQEEAAAAKKAAEEASKAAAEAAAKAQSEADRVASELAAELEAAKAEALKAQEEAAKAQEEASKAIAEASKAAEEAAKASSQLAETTVVPATTPAETTVVPATTPAETTVVVPGETTVAPETTVSGETADKNDALLKYSELKVKYTINDANKYLPANYAELVLLFDKANLDLNNATAEAAASIVATLETDALAVPSITSAAAEVQAQIVALGDIETEVFTVQAAKILEVWDAYDAFVETYEDNLDILGIDDSNVKKKLGINLDELNRADRKLEVLGAYIAKALQADMQFIYDNDPNQRYDATVTASTESTASKDAQIKAKIDNVYYQYLILAAINDGNVDAAKLPIKWEKKLDSDNKPVDDKKKPIAWFTAEELLNVYILPTLDAELADHVDVVLTAFNNAVTKAEGMYTAVNAVVGDFSKITDKTYIVDWRDISYKMNGVSNELSQALYALSYTDDFKGNATRTEAKEAVSTMAIEAYIEAMNIYFAEAKNVAISAFEAYTTEKINGLNDDITAVETTIATTESTQTIERLQANVAKLEAAIVTAEADLDAYIANVEAAALLTYEEMLNEELAETPAYDDGVWADLTDLTNANKTDIIDYLHAVVTTTIDTNFAVAINEIPADPMEAKVEELRANIVKDLYEFIMLVSPYADEYRDVTIYPNDGKLYTELVQTYGRFDVDAEGKSLEGEVKNTQFFLDVIAALNTAIAGIEAVSVEDFEPEYKGLTALKDDKDTTDTSDDEWSAVYFVSADAKNYAIANENFEYDPADLASIAKVMADTDLWSFTKTDYPIEFVITPAEKAIKDLAEKYIAAYDAFNASVNTEYSNQESIAANAKLLITNSTTATAFDTAIKNASGQLKTEMENVRNQYTKKIDSVITDKTKNISNADALKVDEFYLVNPQYVEGKLKSAYVAIDTTANLSTLYDYTFAKLQTNVTAVTSDFDSKVINYTWDDTTTDKNNVVLQLWNMKLEAVEKVNETLKNYKNVYTSTANGVQASAPTLVTENVHSMIYYAYGVTTAGAVQPAYVADYEAELDKLAQATIAKIMAVKIEDTTKITVAKPNGGEFCKNKQINYSLTVAQTVIDAYLNELFGQSTVNAMPNSSTDSYQYGNSLIFKAYNTIVLQNSYGISYR